VTDRLSDAAMREFLAEAGEIVDAMAGGFSQIDAQRETGAPRPATLNDVFRSAHSLKGLAGMFGVDGIGSLAHEMESLLDGLRLGRLSLTDELMSALYACTDTFMRLLGQLHDGDDIGGEDLSAVLGRIRSFTQGGPAVPKTTPSRLKLPREALTVLTEYEEHRLQENLRVRTPMWRVHAPLDLATFEESLGALTDLLGDVGEVITTLPSADASGAGITFDIIAASSQPEANLRQQLGVLGQGRYTLDRIDEVGAPEPPSVSNEGGVAAEAAAAHDIDETALSVRQVSDTVRVDIQKLDELMGIVGELVLARGGLGRVSDELKSEMGYRGLAVDLHRLVRTMERRISDMQTAIMQVRMIPLGQVFDRLRRVVRRTASELGREVDFVVQGDETELDKLIVEELVDPLMHLVRNAVDHGIESPSARLAAGKPRRGTLAIDAFPRGNHVIIDLRDDGRGIDEVAIKRTALERGVVDEERVGGLTRREVWNLIFMPGFSTRQSVSETSGRGVGMDVVKHNISKLSGIIDVDSEQGKGTRFTITLPITLAIIQALIVQSASQIFALPLASVLEIVLIAADQLCTVDGREMVRVRGETLPLLRLANVFGLTPGARRRAEELDGIGYVAVVGLAQHRVALFVDDVTGQQDIVIKSLGAYLSKVRGFAGATQLGDHETILVLDVAALVQDFLDTGVGGSGLGGGPVGGGDPLAAAGA
jgi:two-component system chemotaxis sensor kinase CheA